MIVDYLLYDTAYKHIDTSFSLALIHPDSLSCQIDNWSVQFSSPLYPNPSFVEAVAQRKAADERKRQLNLILGISGAVILSLIAFIALRRRKKRLANE